MEIERGENKQPRALDRASLDKLQALTFEPYEVKLETARNLFLFSCFTGVVYCDMVTLGREHLFTDDKGELWLKFRREKTDTLCRVKLLPKAVHLIERYQSDERITLFAPIAYSAYLTQLKALQFRAGISISLSAHVGRHTFATLITLERGVPIETVSRMLRHNNIQTTERYAHVTPKNVSFLRLYGIGFCRLAEFESFANRNEQWGKAVYSQVKTENRGREFDTPASDSRADTFTLHEGE